MLWMMLAGAMFIVLNTMMKRLAGQLDPWLVGLLRYAIGAAVIATATLRLGPRTLWPRAPRLQFVRGLFHSGGMILWFCRAAQGEPDRTHGHRLQRPDLHLPRRGAVPAASA